MRLDILENTYIRSNPYDVGEPLGVLYSGAVVEAEQHPVTGQEPSYSNGAPENRWYKDAYRDWYYWAGSVRPLEPDAQAPKLPDYRTVFPLPGSWYRGNGRGIKIAVVDTGFDLGHPGLAGFRRAGRCFDLSAMARTQGYSGNGSDSVAPDRPDDYHGTECAGILAGLAPEADLYFFKVRENRLLQLLEALSIASAKGIRLISVSLAYDDVFRLGEDYAELRRLFTAQQQKMGGDTLMLSSVNNPESHLEVLNDVPFPACWKPVSLAVGAVDRNFLSKYPRKPALSPALDVLTVYQRPFPVAAPGGKIRDARHSSSYAAAFLCGMVGLGASAMASGGDSTSPPLSALFQKLSEAMLPYDTAAQSALDQQKMLFINPQT
jgi:subtilisin family serine protease